MMLPRRTHYFHKVDKPMTEQPLLMSDIPMQPFETGISGGYVTLLGEPYYRIEAYDALEPFFMSIVSSSDHWMFIASTGGLSAGRVNADRALFPYYTVDKLTENHDNTGGKTIFRVTRDGGARLWEPFSDRFLGLYRLQRNLYKNIPGTAVVFEEVNADLHLTYRYKWTSSDAYGLVKMGWLINDSAEGCAIEVLDGLQNLMPANVGADVQNGLSVLLDAYKRSELESETGLGIFALSSTLTDLAEPSEALRASTVWQVGLEVDTYLLSSLQLDRFRRGGTISPESDIRGRRGAYFVHSQFKLDREQSWYLVAEVNQDSLAIANLLKALRDDRMKLREALVQDIAANTAALVNIIGRADGLQLSADQLSTAHHFANVMFNVMRGGFFADGYQIESADLRDFVSVRNPALVRDQQAFFAGLPPHLTIDALYSHADASRSPDLMRLCYAYLPLTFSRRHGDPSRPWNRFSIQVKKPDGSRRLNYEGNWRDIFQNWEALAYSFPEFVEGMITTFLNATTFDGYNPYRITRDGIDWEIPEPDNPWANIGYWSDHQIIYLQKLMEISAKVHPGRLESLLTRPIFSYANVPYRIKRYADMQRDPFSTIEFDWKLQHQIEKSVHEQGTDAKLVFTRSGSLYHATLTEKLLTLLLAKIANLVPEGGIWMNTQRPEWNDANNALVGKGLSVVTLCYLRRTLAFCRTLIGESGVETFCLSREVVGFLNALADVLKQFQNSLGGTFSDETRLAVMDQLGAASTDFRWHYYTEGVSGDQAELKRETITGFLDLAQRYVEHSLRANRRTDGLYHAYNLLRFSVHHATIVTLYEMLEGQVAILSSGLLSSDEALTLLDALRHSALYRADQHSYILYPNRELKGFLAKNAIAPELVAGSKLIAALIADRNTQIMVRDVGGVYHFAAELRNAKEVTRILDKLAARYPALVKSESAQILELFETTFNHESFTGRSGSFFAYEGLGSIYWHMVSKLLLAAQEVALQGAHDPVGARLKAAYFDVRQGLGFNKSPQVYGAFPTDPYSHTPAGQGGKQPGMTGMVKEEILTRLAEIGVILAHGHLVFDPVLVNPRELLTESTSFRYLDASGAERELTVPVRGLAYTFCQVPIVIQVGDRAHITIYDVQGGTQTLDTLTLDIETSRHIFARDCYIVGLAVTLPRAKLQA
jgi:hypothetical protein